MNYTKLAHKQRKSDLFRRIVNHGNLKMTDKLIQFRTKQIHNGKILLKCYNDFRCVGYWYLEKVEGMLTVSHGNTETQLKEFAKDYFNQFKKRLS